MKVTSLKGGGEEYVLISGLIPRFLSPNGSHSSKGYGKKRKFSQDYKVNFIITVSNSKRFSQFQSPFLVYEVQRHQEVPNTVLTKRLNKVIMLHTKILITYQCKTKNLKFSTSNMGLNIIRILLIKKETQIISKDNKSQCTIRIAQFL